MSEMKYTCHTCGNVSLKYDCWECLAVKKAVGDQVFEWLKDAIKFAVDEHTNEYRHKSYNE